MSASPAQANTSDVTAPVPTGVDLWANYVRSRYGLAFVALALAIVLLSCALSRTPELAQESPWAPQLGVLIATAWLTLLGWRVVDDLQDRDEDRQRGLDRLSISGSPAALGSLALAALTCAGLLAWSRIGSTNALWLLATTAALLALGIAATRLPFAKRAKPWVALLKYPALVFALALPTSLTPAVLAKLALLYLAFVGNEFLHDARRLGRAPTPRHHALRASLFAASAAAFLT